MQNGNVKLSAYAGVRELVGSVGIDGAMREVRAQGYDGAELLFLTNECDALAADAPGYKAAAEKYGLNIPCISCYTDVVSQNPPYRVNSFGIEAAKKCVDLAREIGCPIVHHTLLTRLSGTREGYGDALAAAISAADEIVKYASAHGVSVIYEPQGIFFNGTEGYSRFFDEMLARHDNVGVCLDVGNTLWVDEECHGLLEKYAGYVKHVHVKDYILDSDNVKYRTYGGRSIKEVALGTGIIDINKIVGSLKKASYQGFVSVEDNSGLDFAAMTGNAKDRIKAAFYLE